MLTPSSRNMDFCDIVAHAVPGYLFKIPASSILRGSTRIAPTTPKKMKKGTFEEERFSGKDCIVAPLHEFHALFSRVSLGTVALHEQTHRQTRWEFLFT